MNQRNNAGTPQVHLYVSGYPCRDYSRLGRMRGIAGRTGELALYSVDYIQQSRPQLALFENVVPHTADARRLFAFLRDRVRDLGYHADWHSLNTANYGLPQSRRRMWLVCVRQDVSARRFRVPRPSGVRINLFALVTPLPPHLWRDLPPDSDQRARDHVLHAYEKFAGDGVNMFETPVVVDTEGSRKFKAFALDSSPCLTRGHNAARSYWCSTKGGPLTVHEMASLQGITRDMLDPVADLGITERQYGAMIGDTMSVNVVCYIISGMLYAGGFSTKRESRGFLRTSGWGL